MIKVETRNVLGNLLGNMYSYSVPVPEQDRGSVPIFRISEFPVCPRKLLLEIVDWFSGNYEQDFFSDFFLHLGSEAHSVVQRWISLSNPNIIIGNWKCRNCNFVLRFKRGSLSCPICGREMVYKEIQLNLSEKLVGFIDGLVIDPSSVLSSSRELPNKGLPVYVLEYKTTSSYSIKSNSLPRYDNVMQASFYASKVQQLLPTFQVKGTLLKYFARDNPRMTSPDFLVLGDKKFSSICGKVISYTEKAFEKSDGYKMIFKLNPCRKWSNFYSADECPYRDECFSMTLKECKEYFIIARKGWKRFIYPKLSGRLFFGLW